MQLKELIANFRNHNTLHAQEQQESKVSEESISLVTFRIQNKEYAIDIDQASEIIKINKSSIVPNSPVYIKGVTNLRGEIIPILNIEQKFEILKKLRDGVSQDEFDFRVFSDKLNPEEKNKKLIQFYDQNKSKNKTAIVVKISDQLFALLIDEILKTISIPINRISLNPLATRIDRDYIKGMVRRGESEENLLLILNLEKISQN